MSRVVDFKRAVFNWEGDDLSLLYGYLQDTFQSMSEDDKKVLEEETARSVFYVPNNKKHATALLFLQNKEFTAPCVNKSAPAYVPTPDQLAKSVAVPPTESVAVSAPDQLAKSVAVPPTESVAVPALRENTSDHAILKAIREFNQDHCKDLPDEDLRNIAFDTLSTMLKEGLS